MIPANLPATKRHVRDYLRQIGREDDWTQLQARAYGPRLIDATPFDGVFELFKTCGDAGVDITIISHKTRRPYRGGDVDLHAAARSWIESHRLVDPRSRDRVYFEPTLDAKLERITTCGCTHFIDDLPEFLGAPEFPRHVRRILFDPHDAHREPGPWRRVNSFKEILNLVEVPSP